MDKYTANRYIWLKQQIAAGGGSVPQELIDEVNALDATVNGDETQEPPVVGLVDIVGDLENTVEDLDLTVNGDSTTTPETPGLVDRVEDLELSVNGDPEATPPILPTVGNVRMSKLWENFNPTSDMGANTEINLSDSNYDMLLIEYNSSSLYDNHGSVIISKGHSAFLTFAAYSGRLNRILTYSSDNKYISEGGYSDQTSAANVCVPYCIYGIKIL